MTPQPPDRVIYEKLFEYHWSPKRWMSYYNIWFWVEQKSNRRPSVFNLAVWVIHQNTKDFLLNHDNSDNFLYWNNWLDLWDNGSEATASLAAVLTNGAPASSELPLVPSRAPVPPCPSPNGPQGYICPLWILCHLPWRQWEHTSSLCLQTFKES